MKRFLTLLVLPVILLQYQSAVAYTDTLNWMGHWYHTDLRYTMVCDVYQEYRFLHQDVKVNLKFPEELFGTNSKLLTAKKIASMIRTDTYDFDVVWMDDNLYQFVSEELGDPFWGRKELVDFSGIPGFNEAHKPFIMRDARYCNQTGGVLCGPYLEGYLYALYYNRTVAQRAGITIKATGATFDDLLGYVKALQSYNQHTGDSVAAFYESGDWLTLEILFQNLVRSLMPDTVALQGHEPAKAAVLRRCLEAFEELGKYRPLIASHEKNIWFETIDLPLKEKCLFFVNGTWMYSRWRAVDPVKTADMIPVELPVLAPVNHCLGGYIPTWAVFKNAPHRSRGIELLMLWCRPQIAEQWVRYTKTPTGLRGGIAKPTMGSDPYEVFTNAMTAVYGDRVMYAYSATYVPGIRRTMGITDLSRVLRDLLTGRTSAAKAYHYLKEQP